MRGIPRIDLRDDEQPTTTRERAKQVLAFDVADPETGEVVAEAGAELSDALRKKLIKTSVTKVEVLLPAGRRRVGPGQEHPGQGPDPQ